MIEVIIEKPLYRNFVYVRDLYLNKAISRGERLKVTIPEGTAIIDPKEWMKTGKKMSKVFKRPEEPMILYGNVVPIDRGYQIEGGLFD